MAAKVRRIKKRQGGAYGALIGPWRYEESTNTIRAEPGHYWLATMDNWGGMPNHAANARLIEAAPEMLEIIRALILRADPSEGEHAARCLLARFERFEPEAE